MKSHTMMTFSAWLATVLLGLWDELRAAFRAYLDPWDVLDREMAAQGREW